MFAPGRTAAGTDAEVLVWTNGGIAVEIFKGWVTEATADTEPGKAEPVKVAKDVVVELGVGGRDGDGEGGVVTHNLGT